MFQTEQNYVLFRLKSMISKAFPNHCVSFKTACLSPPCKHDSFSFIPLFHVGQEENVTMKSRDFKKKFSPPTLYRQQARKGVPPSEEQRVQHKKETKAISRTQCYFRVQICT